MWDTRTRLSRKCRVSALSPEPPCSLQPASHPATVECPRPWSARASASRTSGIPAIGGWAGRGGGGGEDGRERADVIGSPWWRYWWSAGRSWSHTHKCVRVCVLGGGGGGGGGWGVGGACVSSTGSVTTRFLASSYRHSTKPESGKSLRIGWPCNHRGGASPPKPRPQAPSPKPTGLGPGPDLGLTSRRVRLRTGNHP